MRAAKPPSRRRRIVVQRARAGSCSPDGPSSLLAAWRLGGFSPSAPSSSARVRIALAGLAGVGLLGVLVTSCEPRAPAAAPATLGSETVLTLDGRRASMAGVLQGRVALVSLWATWCDACVREIGALNRASAVSASRTDALVVGVAVGESVATVGSF